MIISRRRWAHFGKYLAAFIVFTYVLFHLLQFLTAWIQPVPKYREPNGRAVKVFRDAVFPGTDVTMKDRLKFFYWYGE